MISSASLSKLKPMKWKLILPAVAVCSLTLYYSCKKENNRVPVQILLTDRPTALDQVNVDIKGIQVKLDKDTSGWINLVTNAGVYNLLALQNGITDTIATDNVPDGVLKEIRFILGSNNTVKVNDTLKPLTIPSGSESGLKIKIDKKLGETLNTFVLDFDAALSVKEENGSYKLRPVIKLK
jgi:hypothetical protein